MAKIAAEDTPASDHTQKAGYVGYPIWDETVTAFVDAHHTPLAR